MGAGEIIALVALVFTVLSFVVGALIKSRDNQIAELRRENESLLTRLDTLDKTLAAKQETIAEQHRLLDRLTITAEIQERFFSGVQRHLPSSHTGERHEAP